MTRKAYLDRQQAALMQRENLSATPTETARDFADLAGIPPLNPFA